MQRGLEPLVPILIAAKGIEQMVLAYVMDGKKEIDLIGDDRSGDSS